MDVSDQPTPTRLKLRGTAHLRAFLKRDSARVLVLALIGFVVRLPALQGLPVWDDEWLISQNPFPRSPLLIAEAFRHYLFLDGFSSHYRPIQNASFALDYFCWNTDPYGYHLTNVLLHVGSGALLYLLLCRLLAQFAIGGSKLGIAGSQECNKTRLLAFFIALLWIVHPVHSAAIDYISGRADSLAFLFACSAWLACLHAQQSASVRTRRAYYAAAVFSALLALCSRETACVWLAIFVVHTFCFSPTLPRKRKLAFLICCVAVAVAYGALRQLPGSRSASQSHGWGVETRTVFMFRALGDYGRMLVWPSTLGMERTVVEPQNYVSTQSWKKSARAEYLSILGLGVLSGLVYGCCRRSTGQRLRVFGAFWFSAGFLPISNIVELNATVAEHWLYLPSVGLLLFLAGCVIELPRGTQKLAAAMAIVAAFALGARAYVRSTDWLSPQTFYERTMASGNSSTRIAVNLAIIYLNQGEYAKAENGFRGILKLMPDYPVARNNLAELLYRQGRNEEAKALLIETKAAAAETKKEYPRTWAAALRLAGIHHNDHDDADAIAILDRARAEYPEVWEIVRAESELLREARGPDAALRVVAPFARDHWWHHGATITLGRLLAMKGDAEAAVDQLSFASWLDVHDAEALRLVASIRSRQNRLDEACRAQQRAVSRQPDEPSQYASLAEILQRMGRDAEAQKALATMVRLRAVAQAEVALN